jgi:hypothetical protein
MLLSDTELRRKLQRAARVDREPRWLEVYHLATVLAVLGATSEALNLWRYLYESDIPPPRPQQVSVHGDLILSAVCHQLEIPDISRGHPPAQYVSPDACLAARVEAHDDRARRELTEDRWLPDVHLRAELPHMESLRRYRRALALARPGRHGRHAQTEAGALPLLEEFLDETGLNELSPVQTPYFRACACLLVTDIAARQGNTEDAARRLREWYDLGVRFSGNCVPDYAFGLREVAALLCGGTLADRTTIQREELRELVTAIIAAPVERAGRIPPPPPGVEELTGYLERILEKLRESGRPLAHLLHPGLTREEIDAKTAHLPFKLTEEVYRLYMWRNGTRMDMDRTLGELALFDGVKHLLSLEEALQYYNALAPYRDEFRKEFPDYYGPEITDALGDGELFPLFADGAGGYYYAVCRKETAQTA